MLSHLQTHQVYEVGMLFQCPLLFEALGRAQSCHGAPHQDPGIYQRTTGRIHLLIIVHVSNLVESPDFGSVSMRSSKLPKSCRCGNHRCCGASCLLTPAKRMLVVMPTAAKAVSVPTKLHQCEELQHPSQNCHCAQNHTIARVSERR